MNVLAPPTIDGVREKAERAIRYGNAARQIAAALKDCQTNAESVQAWKTHDWLVSEAERIVSELAQDVNAHIEAWNVWQRDTAMLIDQATPLTAFSTAKPRKAPA